MTDEEMADQSFFNHELSYKVTRDERSYKEGFTEGLKAGKPEWHSVDKEALPDSFRYVWTNVGAGYYDGEHWRDEWGRLRGVTAWCEPQFKGEIK